MPYTEDRAAWFEGQGLWQHIPESDWRDWAWQLKNRITTLGQLETHLDLADEERSGVLLSGDTCASNVLVTECPAMTRFTPSGMRRWVTLGLDGHAQV